MVSQTGYFKMEMLVSSQIFAVAPSSILGMTSNPSFDFFHSCIYFAINHKRLNQQCTKHL